VPYDPAACPDPLYVHLPERDDSVQEFQHGVERLAAFGRGAAPLLCPDDLTLRSGSPIVRAVRARGAILKATEQPIDTGSAAGKCFLDMLGVFAEFETNLRRERQLEGIAKAKAAGVYKGRPPSIEASRVRELKAQGMRPVDIAKALKIGRASVYRVLGQKGANEIAS
jgi:DNA invertase Pin-like site-specific DNA recombinase